MAYIEMYLKILLDLLRFEEESLGSIEENT